MTHPDFLPADKIVGQSNTEFLSMTSFLVLINQWDTRKIGMTSFRVSATRFWNLAVSSAEMLRKTRWSGMKKIEPESLASIWRCYILSNPFHHLRKAFFFSLCEKLIYFWTQIWLHFLKSNTSEPDGRLVNLSAQNQDCPIKCPEAELTPT